MSTDDIPMPAGLFDERVRWTVERIEEPELAALHPDERALVIKAVPKRVREFAAGRAVAHRLLEELGHPSPTILRGANGAPQWPAQVRGSITHAGARVGVAVTADPTICGVGFDIEDGLGLAQKYWHVIMTQEDMQHLERVEPGARERVAKVMFSAKEAAYKAQHALTQTYLPFSAMDVRVSDDERFFVATFHHSVSPFEPGDEIRGSIARFDGSVATSVTLDTR